MKLDASNRNLQSIKDKYAISPLKMSDSLLQPCVAHVEPLWLETVHFQKFIYMQDIFCIVTQCIM